MWQRCHFSLREYPINVANLVYLMRFVFSAATMEGRSGDPEHGIIQKALWDFEFN